ncbi:MAG: PQQ-dependent sugar dehydrogenase [Ilumatobacteraceae bacterium]
MRRGVIAAVLCVVSVTVSVAQMTAGTASALPAGFVDVPVATIPSPTAVEALPGGRVVVLEQDSGRVRLIDSTTGALSPTAALQLAVCGGGERGLLGFTHDPDFATSGRVYVFYTRPSPGAPGGCVNRVSAFVMSGSTIDPASEQVLLDNISSVNGNHNAGDLDVGADGFLYVSTGDAGRDPRGDSGSGGNNDAAQDLSLLNGKILRIDRFTGAPAPGNPLAGGVTCATRGNTPSTPTTTCREIFSWGLRNPFRFAFDPNSTSTRFFVNDVGQSAREEVNEGQLGADYGWNSREGQCPRGQNPPCAGPPPGVTDPITDYGRAQGTFITAGAFVPRGAWPPAFEGGYLFADGGSGRIWLRSRDGSVDWANPILTGAFGITDMAFVDDGAGAALHYTLNGSSQVRKLVAPRTTQVPAGSITRISGDPNGLAVLSVGITNTTAGGFVQVLDCRATPGGFSTLNASGPGQTLANLAVVQFDADGSACIYNESATDIFVDLQGYLAPNAFSARTVRLLDTRQPGPGRPPVPADGRVRFSGEPNGLAVVSIVATESRAPGYLQALPCAAAPGAYSNVNVDRAGQTIANLAIVQLDAQGESCVYTNAGAHVIVDLQGYLAPSSFTPVTQRLRDTRQPAPQPPLPADGRTTVTGRANGLAVVSLVVTETRSGGYVQALSCGEREGAFSNLNADSAGQTRANLAIVPLDGAGSTCLYTQASAHLLADLQGYLDPAVFTPANRRLLDTRQR